MNMREVGTTATQRITLKIHLNVQDLRFGEHAISSWVNKDVSVETLVTLAGHKSVNTGQ